MRPTNFISDSESDDDSGDTACDHHTKRMRTETSKAPDVKKPTKIVKKSTSMRRVDVYLFLDELHDKKPRYVGQSLHFEKRIARHLSVSSKCALMREEWLRRRYTPNPIKLEHYVLAPKLPDGVPECRGDAFEAVLIKKLKTVYGDDTPLGLNCTIGNNVAKIDMDAVTKEYEEGYEWPESPSTSESAATTLALPAALEEARSRANLYENVIEMLDPNDPRLRGELVEAKAQRDALERAVNAENPFQLARTYKEQYESMKPGVHVSRSTAFAELKAVAQMQTDNVELQKQYRVVWSRMMHPDIADETVVTAHQALIVFMAAEEFCARQMEAALHAKHYVKDYDIYANKGGAGGNHYMDALALRDFFDEHDRMPSHAATNNKDAGPGAVAEQRLGKKMDNWKQHGRKEQATYDVVLRHHDVFSKWNADVKMQTHDQSDLLLKLFLASYGIQKHKDADVDPDAKPMAARCRTCGKDDANYQAVKNYLNGTDNATATALDKWEKVKPEYADKMAAYRAVHEKNISVEKERKNALAVEARARGKALREAVASAE